MPKVEVDYSNTIFYKIYCVNPEITDMYIGHTTNFVQRKHAHKQSCINMKCKNYNCKLYNYIREHGGWNNWIMEIIAFRKCEDHYTARKCEQEYFKEYNATLNSIEPLPTPKIKKEIKEKTEKIKKEKLHCNTCNIYFTTTALQELHNNTNKHINRLNVDYKMFTIKTPKNAKKHICDVCHFKCSKPSDYNRHLMTAKHQILTNTYNLVQKNAKAFTCECGKEYKHRQSLNNHKRKCQYIAEEEPTEKQLMMTIIKQNGELVKTIQEIVPKIGVTTNNTNNTNCNNTFNVQMFLDNQCKNAISIQDLINSIELNNSDLVAIGNNGYVDSISNILIQALNKLDVTDRPLHCTDLKRDVIYYKTDKWNKSKSTDELMDKTVERIENKHFPLISNYRKQTPDANEVGTKEHTIYEKTFINILGNNVDQDKRNKQIFKKVLPEVKLDKEHII